jgi:hypothetical protein
MPGARGLAGGAIALQLARGIEAVAARGEQMTQADPKNLLQHALVWRADLVVGLARHRSGSATILLPN